jgi:hypothetical protein
MRLRGSENNNFVQGLAIGEICGLHNSQRQLDSGFNHTKSSYSFGDIIRFVQKKERNRRDIFQTFPARFLIPKFVDITYFYQSKSESYIVARLLLMP